MQFPPKSYSELNFFLISANWYAHKHLNCKNDSNATFRNAKLIQLFIKTFCLFYYYIDIHVNYKIHFKTTVEKAHPSLYI